MLTYDLFGTSQQKLMDFQLQGICFKMSPAEYLSAQDIPKLESLMTKTQIVTHKFSSFKNTKY